MVVVSSGKKKNTGQLGVVCNNCGGFGYTLKLEGGGSLGCSYCNQTGIAQPTTAELNSRLTNLEFEIQGLKNIIVKSLKGKV